MRNKYRFVANDFVIPIFPKYLYNIKLDENEVSKIKNKYRIKETDTIFIYSGNAQKWQKIELMMRIIKTLSLKNNYKFFILTGEYKKFQNLLSKYGLESKDNIFLDSVSPDKLSSYYLLAHYGFLLRDKHILNNVACPTKSVEYLCFGIIPIVLEENIGDFKELGYEYISIKKINSSILKPRKSITNIKVAQYIKNKYLAEIEKLKESLNK